MAASFRIVVDDKVGTANQGTGLAKVPGFEFVAERATTRALCITRNCNRYLRRAAGSVPAGFHKARRGPLWQAPEEAGNIRHQFSRRHH